MAGNETRDSAAESLTALADELEHSLGDAVTIDRWAVPGDGVTLTPTRNTALAVGWMDFGDEVYLETECPRGQMGFYIVGDGQAEPLRARAKSSCFCNLSVTGPLCEGILIADIPAIVGSLDVVMGEIDR